MGNDDYYFAIVELLQEFVLGGFSRPIPLTPSGSPEVFHMYAINLPLPEDYQRYREGGTRVLASGWGSSETGPLGELRPSQDLVSSIGSGALLTTTSIPVISNRQCKQVYADGSLFHLTARHMCVALENDRFCPRDSGGKDGSPKPTTFF